MGDHAMALMQQQMQQTMNAREQAAQAAAELAAQRQQQQGDAPAADNDTEQSVEVDPSETEQPAEVVQPRTEPVPVCKYTPKVPYPVPAKATRKDREEMKCKKMLLMKGLISGKISEDSNFMIISKECSAVLQNKTIRKLGDPGKFVLSLQVGRTVFSCSLVDLGSSVNLIPYSVARRYVPISYHTL
ncbi:hypothetical protein F2Q70_00035766 [Brassica cretica]|uniref:Uncharacterized protein n=1 Tax=Brassica cretica TaxID=69181 RepID=A0A8S9JW36_BRACR|nr:hypothetical protein F2Q70_00035766 [Brassica cretica]